MHRGGTAVAAPPFVVATLLLIGCVAAVAVAGGILVLLFGPTRGTKPVRALPRASMSSIATSWQAAPPPAPAAEEMLELGDSVIFEDEPAPVSIPVEAPPARILATPGPMPRPAFAPVVKPHGALPPRPRVARGTDSPPRPARRTFTTDTTTQVSGEFETEESTSIDDPTMRRDLFAQHPPRHRN